MSDTDAPATGEDTETTEPEAPATGAEALGDPGKKALDAMKAQVREAKAEARKAAAELERIQRESLPEQERLIAEAKAAAEAETVAKFASRLVDAEVKAAAIGRPVDAEALLEGLDRTKYVTTDGEPDTAAITAWLDRVAPKQDTPAPTADLGQGARAATGDLALNGDPLLRDLKSKLGID